MIRQMHSLRTCCARAMCVQHTCKALAFLVLITCIAPALQLLRTCHARDAHVPRTASFHQNPNQSYNFINHTMDQIRQALDTMYSGADQSAKKEATIFLEAFQKSPEAWTLCQELLDNSNEPIQFRMFAAQTLRAKTTYDLSQVPADTLAELKELMLHLVTKYHHEDHERLISVQLCLALSQVCLQMTGWSNPMGDISERLMRGPELAGVMLRFLKVLPEEVSDANKSAMSEEDFAVRTKLLISDNVDNVMALLTQMARDVSGGPILDCLNSWIKECPVEKVVSQDTLVALVFKGVTEPATFDAATECLCSILRETRDLDNENLIDALFDQLIQLDRFYKDNRANEDVLAGLTKVFVEAGESWHVLIAKNPGHFSPLVRILLECCGPNRDLDVVKYTFYFWYELKQMVTLPKFEAARREILPVYVELIHVIIGHLRYPMDTSDEDLFDGDKEQEDKFKEFRYEMGDVLKDCCAVAGAQQALQVPFEQINTLVHQQNPQWQLIEAPLFSMRVMAKEVSMKENTMLPVIMQLLLQLPEHSKVRYATTLVLGRYSEWTAAHPEYLEVQLNYITKAFASDTTDKDVVSATCQALMYFCQDCASHLVGYLDQLHVLYHQVHGQVDTKLTYDLLHGLACVIKELPLDRQYATAELFMGPTLERLAAITGSGNGGEGTSDIIHDNAEAVSIFLQVLRTNDYEQANYPIADFFMGKIWPLLAETLSKFGASLHVSESVVKVIKNAIQSCSIYLAPILPQIAETLHSGFHATFFGCYLWVSGVILREFSDESVSEDLQQAVYHLGVQQSAVFFSHLSTSSVDLRETPDVIEDFFAMANEMLMFYPNKTIANGDLMSSILDAAVASLLASNEFHALIACVHFFADFVAWGSPYPPISFFDEDPKHIQQSVKVFLASNGHGEKLMKSVLFGLVHKFFNDPDANDLIVKIITVSADPNSALHWLQNSAMSLDHVTVPEVEKLISTVSVAASSKDTRRMRVAIKDFVSWYSRRNASRLKFQNR